MIRPEAAEAPGVAIERTEDREEPRKTPATMPAPVTASVQSKKITAKAEDKISLDDEMPMEESVIGMATDVSKEEPTMAAQDGASICAALAKAIEEAEADEDWTLAEKLTQQMIAQGCVSGADFDAVEEQGARYKQKAIEAELIAPTENDDSATETAPAPEEAVEPDQMK